MLNNKDKSAFLERYSKRLKEFGYDVRSLGWNGGVERQALRFKVLSEIGIESGDSVLDVGCGFGDLYDYLTKQNWRGTYKGLDLNPDLLEIARQQYPGIDVDALEISDPSFAECKFDWVVACGVFNVKLQHQDHWSYVVQMLQKMFDKALKGVAVDFMSTFVDYQAAETFHADPAEVLKELKQLSWRVSLRLDYLPYEFAAYCYHLHNEENE